MKNQQFFNHQHPLHAKLANIKFTRTKRPVSTTVDLRFLTSLSWGDTFDGQNNPCEGLGYQAIIYGNRVMCEKRRNYFDCKGIGPSAVSGCGFFFELYRVSIVYKEIIRIAFAKYHGNPVPPSERKHSLVELGPEEVFIGTRTLRILKKHPQFLELVRHQGLKLKSKRGSSVRKVVVTKFRKK